MVERSLQYINSNHMAYCDTIDGMEMARHSKNVTIYLHFTSTHSDTVFAPGYNIYLEFINYRPLSLTTFPRVWFQSPLSVDLTQTKLHVTQTLYIVVN